MATELMHTVEDFERIGDHGMNLLEVAEYNKEQEIEFSKDGIGFSTSGRKRSHRNYSWCDQQEKESLDTHRSDVFNRESKEYKAMQVYYQ